MLVACKPYTRNLISKLVHNHTTRYSCRSRCTLARQPSGRIISQTLCKSQPHSSSHSSSTNRGLTTIRHASNKSKYSSDLVRSVRAMPIKLITVGKGNSQAATAMAQEWITKLARYTAVKEVQIKPNPKGSASPQVQKEAEAEKVLKAITPDEKVVMLDERGRDATSEDIARLIALAGDNGTPLVFVVGGPFGHGPPVVERADDSIKLSRMVLNHQVAYIILIEQLYRGWTIIRGEPYHH